MSERIAIPKTYKLYINGKFPRSERGRVLPQHDAEGNWVANYCWSTRKDFRNAVQAARAAQGGWAKRSAFNRSLILYRIAETLEDRRDLFERKLMSLLDIKAEIAAKLVSKSIDVIFFYAGWADKYGPVLSSVNPVSQPFFNFTTPEPTGVVAAFVSRQSPLVGLVCAICPIILSGNSCLAIVENVAPTLAIDFAEVLAVSDVPSGVVNVLTGTRDELIAHVAGHMDLNGIAYYGGAGDEWRQLETIAAENLKRTKRYDDMGLEDWISAETSLYTIQPFVEFKTTWHPIGV
ncbi:MAG: aldehyde dehydrogenase family protein [Candidatus Promineifilaceae bacterium]